MSRYRLICVTIIALFLMTGIAEAVEEGWATYYTNGSAVRARTANGELFNEEHFTCAAWWLPFNSVVRVANVENGRSVVVRVNDRGPALDLYCVEYTNRPVIVDLTKAAFERIGELKQGKIKVTVEVMR